MTLSCDHLYACVWGLLLLVYGALSYGVSSTCSAVTLACAHLHDVCVGPYAISVWGLKLLVRADLFSRDSVV